MPESAPLTDQQLITRLKSGDEAHRLVVAPLVTAGQIGSTSIDLRLGTRWQVLKTSRFQSLDPGRDPEEMEHLIRTSADEFRVTVGEADSLVVHPGELMLALSLEFLRLPPDLWGQLEGRSTWARVGLQVHATAGMVDPGFAGYLTFELQNMGRIPLSLFPGLRVGQIAFFPLAEVGKPYSKKPDAAYTSQYSVQSAFAQQPEHQAMARYRDEQQRTAGDFE